MLVFLSLFCINTSAQENRIGSFFKGKSNTDLVENIDSIKLVADSLHRELVSRDSVYRVNTGLVDSIRASAKQDSLR